MTYPRYGLLLSSRKHKFFTFNKKCQVWISMKVNAHHNILFYIRLIWRNLCFSIKCAKSYPSCLPVFGTPWSTLYSAAILYLRRHFCLFCVLFFVNNWQVLIIKSFSSFWAFLLIKIVNFQLYLFLIITVHGTHDWVFFPNGRVLALYKAEQKDQLSCVWRRHRCTLIWTSSRIQYQTI